jgi:serine/threonine protein kinase
MIIYEGHTFITDWSSFGIIIFEMLYGNTPFFNIDKNRMYDLIT